MTMHVIGALAVPANSAAMPTSAKEPMIRMESGTSKPGRSATTTDPSAPPRPAPMKRVGAKTPPDPPEPRVNEVATPFNRAMTTNAPKPTPPANDAFMNE